MYINILKLKSVSLFLLIYLFLFLLTCNNGFFWDTTHLAAKQAWWFYENGAKVFFIPPSFDSGHPPFFAMLLSACWNIGGVSLVISHLLMLPFMMLLVIQVVIVARHYFRERYFYPAAIILVNPIVLAQCTLVSPDIILLSFFYLTLNAILKKRYFIITVGCVVLCAVSMRGMVVSGVLFLFAVFTNPFSLKGVVGKMVLFLPGFLVAITFLILHYKHTGWVGHHALSPWSPSFEQVGVKGFFRNIIVFGWRMVDMGMFFMWILLGIIMFKARKKAKHDNNISQLIVLAILIFIFTILPQFFYAHLLMHRYLMPLIGVTSLIFFWYCQQYLAAKSIKIFSIIVIVALISGNLWIYPDNIAKGWDATLGHLPYYSLRHKALAYIKEKQIPLNQISAAFPYDMEDKYIDLKNDTIAFSVKLPEDAPYVLYSNIANQYSDEELNLLKTKFIPVQAFGKWPVRFVLYKNLSY